jgi:TonB dependent receptor/Carboxypeptidase regulatory-like domain
MVGGLVLLCTTVVMRAQGPQPVTRVAALAAGSIEGVVHDEKGTPIAGAMVSALGATTAFATTDRGGHFELRTLSPGPYLVRAHSSGYIAPRGQIIDVRPSSRVSSSIGLRHVSAPSVLTADFGGASTTEAAPAPVAEGGTNGSDDDHGEMAWRLRHARRGVLKDATVPEDLLADTPDSTLNVFAPVGFLERAVGSPAHLATNFFGNTPFTGQVNLLTTGSFDAPQQLFALDSLSHGVAYVSVGAPAGGTADWTVRSALTQGDIASWIVAGSYATRTPARHRYDVGLSYATQRYDGGNTAALRTVTDGSRNAGAIYGIDTFTISPAVTLTYGARYSRYDYLSDRSLVSPRVALTLAPAEHLRINTLISSRAVAPGAEEFLPPADNGIWLPPQRTFSPLDATQPLSAERTTHVDVEVERDLGSAATLMFRGFHQHVDDQLVTMFGVQMPGAPATDVGHYFVANSGNVDAAGWSAGIRAALADRVHASLEYSLARATWYPGDGAGADYLLLVAPSAVRLESEQIHDLSTAVETELPETSTRVLVLYRVSNAFARPAAAGQTTNADRPALDGRFDVQVRQSLPFMNFSTAHWEMLVAVRNFFRDTTVDQSLYDELLVVRPPKRIVGGLTLRF